MRGEAIFSVCRIYSFGGIGVKRFVPYLICVAAGLLLAAFPAEASTGVIEGLRLCGSRVIPALFPFFILSKFLIASLPALPSSRVMCLFGVSPRCFSALFVSFLGGYPLGAATLVSLYEQGQIEREDARRAVRFCNNSGPAFFLGMIGRVLGDIRAGLILYLIHCVSALLVGLTLAEPYARRTCKIQKAPTKAEETATECFLRSVADSSAALLQISALVIVFSVVKCLLGTLLPIDRLSSSGKALALGCLELTSGVAILPVGAYAFVIGAFLMGWGGLCVHMQTLALCAPLGVRSVFLPKLLHGIFSAALALLYLRRDAASLIYAAALLGVCVLFSQIRRKGWTFTAALRYNNKRGERKCCFEKK